VNGPGAPVTLALVLGGGGVAGVAWHTGLLLGLAESGADPSAADLLVGTSAGSTVAAQLGGGHRLGELYARQVDPATLATERTPPVTVAELLGRLGPIYSAGHDADERRRLLGAMALDTVTVDEEVRRAVIAGRLVGSAWPERPLLVPVVDAASGDRRVLDRASGVDLVDAVAASSAVPGVWPPVTIEGSRYIDGGVWSLTNTDLASGHDRVLVLAPIVDPALEVEITGLGPDVRVEVVRPDAASIEAFGTDVLDPANREPSARAGHAQGPAEVGRVRDLLAY
jgi:NTE family protein